eukprot:g3213.t1
MTKKSSSKNLVTAPPSYLFRSEPSSKASLLEMVFSPTMTKFLMELRHIISDLCAKALELPTSSIYQEEGRSNKKKQILDGATLCEMRQIVVAMLVCRYGPVLIDTPPTSFISSASTNGNNIVSPSSSLSSQQLVHYNTNPSSQDYYSTSRGLNFFSSILGNSNLTKDYISPTRSSSSSSLQTSSSIDLTGTATNDCSTTKPKAPQPSVKATGDISQSLLISKSDEISKEETLLVLSTLYRMNATTKNTRNKKSFSGPSQLFLNSKQKNNRTSAVKPSNSPTHNSLALWNDKYSAALTEPLPFTLEQEDLRQLKREQRRQRRRVEMLKRKMRKRKKRDDLDENANSDDDDDENGNATTTRAEEEEEKASSDKRSSRNVSKKESKSSKSNRRKNKKKKIDKTKLPFEERIWNAFTNTLDLVEIIDLIREVDTYATFERVPDLDDVPDYLDVISKPMSFYMMHKKAERQMRHLSELAKKLDQVEEEDPKTNRRDNGLGFDERDEEEDIVPDLENDETFYSLESLEKDLDLIYDNCIEYNGSEDTENNFFFQQAELILRTKGRSVVSKSRALWEQKCHKLEEARKKKDEDFQNEKDEVHKNNVHKDEVHKDEVPKSEVLKSEVHKSEVHKNEVLKSEVHNSSTNKSSAETFRNDIQYQSMISPIPSQLLSWLRDWKAARIRQKERQKKTRHALQDYFFCGGGGGEPNSSSNSASTSPEDSSKKSTSSKATKSCKKRSKSSNSSLNENLHQLFGDESRDGHRFMVDMINDQEGTSPSASGGSGVDYSYLFLSGPTGCGKTALVHNCARQCGYEVLEIHAGSKRSASELLECLEATQSHSVMGLQKQLINNEKARKKNKNKKRKSQQVKKKSNNAKKSSKYIQGGMFDTNRKRQKRLQEEKRRKDRKACDQGDDNNQGTSDQPIIIHDERSASSIGGGVGVGGTNAIKKVELVDQLILIDAVDCVFANRDKNFFSALRQLMAKAKRPIVFTSNRPLSSFPVKCFDLENELVLGSGGGSGGVDWDDNADNVIESFLDMDATPKRMESKVMCRAPLFECVLRAAFLCLCEHFDLVIQEEEEQKKNNNEEHENYQRLDAISSAQATGRRKIVSIQALVDLAIDCGCDFRRLVNNLHLRLQSLRFQDEKNNKSRYDTTTHVTQEISDVTQEISDVTQEISDVTQEISDGTQEISDGTQEISDGTQKTSDGTQKTSDGTQKISDGTQKTSDDTTTKGLSTSIIAPVSKEMTELEKMSKYLDNNSFADMLEKSNARFDYDLKPVQVGCKGDETNSSSSSSSHRDSSSSSSTIGSSSNFTSSNSSFLISSNLSCSMNSSEFPSHSDDLESSKNVPSANGISFPGSHHGQEFGYRESFSSKLLFTNDEHLSLLYRTGNQARKGYQVTSDIIDVLRCRRNFGLDSKDGERRLGLKRNVSVITVLRRWRFLAAVVGNTLPGIETKTKRASSGLILTPTLLQMRRTRAMVENCDSSKATAFFADTKQADCDGLTLKRDFDARWNGSENWSLAFPGSSANNKIPASGGAGLIAESNDIRGGASPPTLGPNVDSFWCGLDRVTVRTVWSYAPFIIRMAFSEENRKRLSEGTRRKRKSFRHYLLIRFGLLDEKTCNDMVHFAARTSYGRNLIEKS